MREDNPCDRCEAGLLHLIADGNRFFLETAKCNRCHQSWARLVHNDIAYAYGDEPEPEEVPWARLPGIASKCAAQAYSRVGCPGILVSARPVKVMTCSACDETLGPGRVGSRRPFTFYDSESDNEELS